MNTSTHVSIVGCGLAGLALAIMLHREGFSFDIYEMREPSAAHAVGGAVSLCPNSLRLLNELGIYGRLKHKGVQQTSGLTLDEDLRIRDTISWGDEQMYGYKALRIGREEFIEEMKAALREKGVFAKIHWEHKFAQIVSDDESGVEIEFEDGSRRRTDLLIGADGIHSKVRQHIADVPAVYAGYFMCLSYVPTSALRFPPELEEHRLKPGTVQCPVGGFHYVAQGPDGKYCFCLRQFHHPEQDAVGWRALRQDKKELLIMLRRDYESFPDLVKSAMDAATESGMDVWPIYTIPKLVDWMSPSGRVVLVGDAGHAIPPAAGQGVNMAIEDAYSLVVLLKELQNSSHLRTGLSFWQSWRQERVEKVRKYAMQLSMARMSAEERTRRADDLGEPPNGAKGELKWLFAPEPGLREQIEALARRPVQSQLTSDR